MSTKAQTKANRQNAKKSTGPQTVEGKDAVSQNAVKHGIFAESVIRGEDPADYEAFQDKMLAELNPVGVLESMLADRIVSLWWRLRRADRIQNQAIDVMIARDKPSPLSKRMHNWLPKDLQEIDYDTRGAGPELVLGRSIISDFSSTRVLERLMLYERRIESSLTRIMKELKRYQIMRRIEREDADEQYNPSLRLRSGQAPSIRDKAATQSNSLSQSETATRLAEKHDDLKKQTQFAQALMGATSFMKGDYGNKAAIGIEENKANQSQLHARETTKGAGKREKSVAASSG